MQRNERIQIRKILEIAESSSEAIRLIYELLKANRSQVSFGYLAQRMGLKSRSYVSDIINEKRQMPQKLLPSFIEAMGLEPVVHEFLGLMLEIENEKSKDRTVYLQGEREKLVKLFQMHEGTQEELKFSNVFFTIEVFVSLSLFAEEASVEKIVDYFGGNTEAVVTALKQLESMGAITVSEGGVKQTKKHLQWSGGDKARDLINYYREGLRQTQFILYKWFLKPAQAYFDSSVISVNRAQYEKLLPIIKKEAQKLKALVEQDDGADQLVRFNLQIYPVDHSSKGR